jgi:hypothetical protein
MLNECFPTCEQFFDSEQLLAIHEKVCCTLGNKLEVSWFIVTDGLWTA